MCFFVLYEWGNELPCGDAAPQGLCLLQVFNVSWYLEVSFISVQFRRSPTSSLLLFIDVPGCFSRFRYTSYIHWVCRFSRGFEMNFRILFGICFGGPGGIFESHGGKMMEDEVPPRTGYRGIA